MTKEDIIKLLSLSDKDHESLIKKAGELRDKTIGPKVYFRGLIEYSNLCVKNCFYCGIRRDNKKQERYTMTDDEVLECARFAYENRYGSLVIQSGERSDAVFVDKIEYFLKEIKKLSDGRLGITLSLGEQTEDTYRRWFKAGAHRYLLRIEASGKKLYPEYHPKDGFHEYDDRIRALELIKKCGYQVGTGVMIGLLGQSISDLADDLLFFKKIDVDMVGMGPYIENENTPMYSERNRLLSRKERFDLALRMIAVLRIMMPEINMAATTAMQALDPAGREKAIKAGANIIMPNLTPVKYRLNYMLYDGKPCIDEDAAQCSACLAGRIKAAGAELALDEWGDSKHFQKKTGK